MVSHNSLDQSISKQGVWLVLIIAVFNANSVDTDQMQHSAASDLCLQCLPVTLLGVSQLK